MALVEKLRIQGLDGIRIETTQSKNIDARDGETEKCGLCHFILNLMFEQ